MGWSLQSIIIHSIKMTKKLINTSPTHLSWKWIDTEPPQTRSEPHLKHQAFGALRAPQPTTSLTLLICVSPYQFCISPYTNTIIISHLHCFVCCRLCCYYARMQQQIHPPLPCLCNSISCGHVQRQKPVSGNLCQLIKGIGRESLCPIQTLIISSELKFKT